MQRDPVPASGVVGLVLAGGRSSRYGTDKTRAVFDGATLLERTVDIVSPLVESVLVIGPWAPRGVRTAVEADRGSGPLAAFDAGLDATSSEHVVLLACDHSLLEMRLLSLLIDRRAPTRAVVPVDDRSQPLVAVYPRSVAPIVARLVASGERRFGALLDEIDVDWVTHSDWAAVDPDGRSFRDVDTPDDLRRAESLGHRRR